MTIKVKIKAGSKADKFLKNAMADKAAFREAVAAGHVSSYVKESGTKHASPISAK